MHPSARTAVRRAAGALLAVAALGGTFTLGAVAGAGSAANRDEPSARGVLDEAANQIVASALKPVDRRALDAAAIQAMLGAVGDPWGGWADAPIAGTPGGYVGVGLWLRRTGTALLVAQVAAGSAADRAGVRTGDELRAVDDRSSRELAASDVAASLRGPVGSAAVVILRRGATIRSITLVRAPVQDAGVTTTMAAPGVGRIAVPAFSAGVGRSVRAAVARLRAGHATGALLDLRGDPGGLLSEAVETASVFLDSGQVVTYSRRDRRPQRLDVEGHGDTRMPVVVLVDGGTASAAEVVAGALQDRGRAVVVGSRTFGKGSVQEPHRLPDGSSLALTVARYVLPSGRSVEGVGLEPDIEVGTGVRTGDQDPVVRRAVEVLSGLTADAGAGG